MAPHELEGLTRTRFVRGRQREACRRQGGSGERGRGDRDERLQPGCLLGFRLGHRGRLSVSGGGRAMPAMSTDMRVDGGRAVVIVVMAVEMGVHERCTPRAHLQGGTESHGDQPTCHRMHCSGSAQESQDA